MSLLVAVLYIMCSFAASLVWGAALRFKLELFSREFSNQCPGSSVISDVTGKATTCAQQLPVPLQKQKPPPNMLLYSALQNLSLLRSNAPRAPEILPLSACWSS
jgi:hypothetical protein